MRPRAALLLIVVSSLAAACSSKDKKAGVDAGSGALSVGTASASAASVGSTSVDTVTNASQMLGDGGVVLTGGEVDANLLRIRQRARLKADSSAVTILKNGTPRELGMRICEKSVPERPKHMPILIKPNIGGFEWFKDPATHGGDDGVHGRTTDSEFVRGIVQCLKKRGHTQITIAEGYAGTHAHWKKLMKVSGYDRVAAEEGVKLVAMDDDGVFDVEGDTPGKPLKVKGMESTGVPNLLMPKVLAQHLQNGMWISAPKVKAHRFSVVSMGIKGMQGTVMTNDASPAFHQKWRTHKELAAALKLITTDKEAGQKAYLDSLHVFAERMVDLLEVSAPDVVLAEGAPAMGGDGFGKRWPSAESFAIGGTNPVLVDRVGAAMLGLWDNAELARELGGHKTSPLIEAAAKRFGIDLSVAPKLEGDGVDLLSTKRPVHFLSMNGFSLLSDKVPPEIAPGRSSSSSSDVDEDAGGGAAAALAEAHAHKVDAIVVDGEMDDAWKSSPPVSFTTDWSGAEAGIRTSARFAWTKNALYLLWELDQAGINVDESKPVGEERAKLYEEDCVELMIGSHAEDRTKYFELEVGPLGHFLDIAVERGGAKKRQDVGWSSQSKIATKVDRAKKKAVIEVEIRAPEIVGALRSGAVLPMALYRIEGKAPGRKYLAFSPTRTPKPDFHVPDAFGTLRIE